MADVLLVLVECHVAAMARRESVCSISLYRREVVAVVTFFFAFVKFYFLSCCVFMWRFVPISSATFGNCYLVFGALEFCYDRSRREYRS